MRLFAHCLVVLVTVAILAFFRWTTPSYAILTGPLETYGSQRQMVQSPTFGLRANKVIETKTIAFERYGKAVERQTDGIFLIVTVDAEARRQTMMINAAAVRGASGRMYHQTHRADGAPQLINGKEIQPGLSKAGIFVFEMPQQDAEQATLVVSEQLGPRLDSEISIALDPNGVERRDRVEIANAGL